jgi:uncharacterized protein (UPF0332 family)
MIHKPKKGLHAKAAKADNLKTHLYRLAQADETILDVQLLIENNRLRSAVNRIYYGMFYSLLALGLANQFDTSKHAQLNMV